MQRFCAPLLLLVTITLSPPAQAGDLPSLAPTSSATATTDAAKIGLRPYLQRVTTTSAIIRWQTPDPTIGVLRYGKKGGSLDHKSDDHKPTYAHALLATNLAPDSQYDYATNAPGLDNATRSFRTFPPTTLEGDPATPARATRPTRTWVLGDEGSGYPAAYATRDAYTTFTANSPPADAIILLGDNAYNRGTYPEYKDKFFKVFADQLAVSSCYAGMGDHDLYSANSKEQSGVYYDLFELPAHGESGGVPSGTEAYFSFDCGAVHYVCIESMMDLGPDSPQVRWLKADLAAARRAPWIVAYMHWPPYTKGPYDSDKAGNLTSVRQKLLPVLEQGGVDLVLAGHSHDYERSALIAGHYGVSDTLTSGMLLDAGPGPYQKPAGHKSLGGTVYVVLGCSSYPKPRLGHHPIMRNDSTSTGSGIIDADATNLEFKFLTSAGKVEDQFTLTRAASK